MTSINRLGRFVRAFALSLLCTLAVSAGSQPNQGRGAPDTPPAPNPPPQAGGRKLCDLRHLAMLIDERYARPGYPIATYEVVGFDGLPTPRGSRTFVVIAQGVTDQGFLDYWLPQIARNYPADATNADRRSISDATTPAGNGYDRAILGAASTPDAVPPGSNLILAGASLGGMEHQNLVPVLKQRGFSVPYVVTFGSPVVARPDPGTLYRYVKADGDLVAAADRVVAGDASVIRIPGGSVDLLDVRNGSHHIYPKSAALEKLDIFGDRRTLSSPCLEIDLATRREHAVPGLGAVAKAERPVDVSTDCPDCLSAAIAQDQQWAMPNQRLAAPKVTAGTVDEQIERTLKALYGSNPTDPRLAPARQRSHREGKPVPSSAKEIETELRDAGSGSRGLVFSTTLARVKVDRPGQADRYEWREDRHVINARCVADPKAPGGRRVEYYDAGIVDPSKRDITRNAELRTVYLGANSALSFYRTH